MRSLQTPLDSGLLIENHQRSESITQRAAIVQQIGSSRVLNCCKQTRRGGRVAEGGGLLNRYRVKSSIGGSNPPLSASDLASF